MKGCYAEMACNDGVASLFYPLFGASCFFSHIPLGFFTPWCIGIVEKAITVRFRTIKQTKEYFVLFVLFCAEWV